MFTLLQLAHAHLPEFDNLLSDENLALPQPDAETPATRARSQLLRRARRANGRSAAQIQAIIQEKTEQAFAEHRDYLLRDIDHLTAQLAEITTLQTLKPYLAARWDQQQIRWREEEDDMEWCFGNGQR